MRDRLPPRSTIGDAVAVLREAWPDDGAEGESVHLVCDALEAAWRELDEVSARLPDDGRTLAERAINLGERVTQAERATKKLQEVIVAASQIDLQRCQHCGRYFIGDEYCCGAPTRIASIALPGDIGRALDQDDEPVSWRVQAELYEQQSADWMNRAQRAEHERDQAIRRLSAIASAALETVDKLARAQ